MRLYENVTIVVILDLQPLTDVYCVCVCVCVCVRVCVCVCVFTWLCRLCGLDCYLALVLICLIQILSAIDAIRENFTGAHPVHLQICVLLLRRAYKWYMVCVRGARVQGMLVCACGRVSSRFDADCAHNCIAS